MGLLGPAGPTTERRKLPQALGPKGGWLPLRRSWGITRGRRWGAAETQRKKKRRGDIRVWWLPLTQSTYFICLTMVLFPDSPAPGTEGTGGQGAALAGLHGQSTRGPATRSPGGRTHPPHQPHREMEAVGPGGWQSYPGCSWQGHSAPGNPDRLHPWGTHPKPLLPISFTAHHGTACPSSAD